jgi:hypothetical protein
VEVAGRPWAGAEPGPVPGLREFAREKSGAIWLGSTNGAARFDPKAKHRWDRWQYFWGKRWLPDNDVRNIVVEEGDPTRNVWIRTQTAIALIEWRPMTLAQKAALFEERIAARHVRHGMVSDSALRVPGDITSSVTHDSDNDGLWTAIYLGAEAYRYAVTREPQARANARRSAQLLMRLEEITGIPGFPARSFVSTNEPKPHSGEWHPTPGGQWLWKGDTSSDEIVGHYFGYALYFDLVADDADKVAVSKVVARITDHLVRNDYDLIDLDGRPTRWGSGPSATSNRGGQIRTAVAVPGVAFVPEDGVSHHGRRQIRGGLSRARPPRLRGANAPVSPLAWRRRNQFLRRRTRIPQLRPAAPLREGAQAPPDLSRWAALHLGTDPA